MIEQALAFRLPIALSANPIDWPGPQFLGLFVFMYLLAITLGILLRRRYVQVKPTQRIAPEHLPVSYVAYLRGGQRQMALANLSSLVHEGQLEVQSRLLGATFFARSPLSPGADDVARIIYQEASQPEGLDVSKLPSVLSNYGTRVRESLEDKGLLLRDRWALLPAIPMTILFGLGVTKFIVGMNNDRPVLFLFIGLVVCLISLIALVKLPRLTKAGSSAIRSLQEQNANLNFGKSAHYQPLDAGSIAMSVAVFGLASSPMTQLDTLHQTFKSGTTNSGSVGTGCGAACGGAGGAGGGGGTGCGGGGGGGGCGGCGGG